MSHKVFSRGGDFFDNICLYSAHLRPHNWSHCSASGLNCKIQRPDFHPTWKKSSSNTAAQYSEHVLLPWEPHTLFSLARQEPWKKDSALGRDDSEVSLQLGHPWVLLFTQTSQHANSSTTWERHELNTNLSIVLRSRCRDIGGIKRLTSLYAGQQQKS